LEEVSVDLFTSTVSNLSRAELLAAIEAKRFNATKTGGEWKIRREAFEEYIRKNF
jgi:excisionase family DNA binding protein